MFLTLKIMVLFVCLLVCYKGEENGFNMLNLVILYELPLLIMEQEGGKITQI